MPIPISVYSNIDLRRELAIPESRLREITMPDDSRNKLDRIDNMMDLGGGFGDGDGDLDLNSLEVLRDAIAPKHSTLHESRGINLEASKDKSTQSDNSINRLAYMESFRISLADTDSGFGGGELTSLDDIGVGLPSIDETDELFLTMDTSNQGQPAPEDMETDRAAENGNVSEQQERSAMSDFTLAALDISTVTFKKPRPPTQDGVPAAKKRKSTAKYENKYSTTEIRSWLHDTSDIDGDVLAAPSKRSALFSKLYAEQKLFDCPIQEFSEVALQQFQKLNHTEGERDTEDSEVTDESTVDDVFREMQGNEEPNYAVDMDSIILEPVGDGQGSTLGPLESSDLVQGQSTVDTTDFGDLGVDGIGDPLQYQNTALPSIDEELLVNGEEDTEPRADEQPDEYEVRRWNKTTENVLSRIDSVFGKNKDIPFSRLLEKSSRKQAATQFFSVLLLTTKGSIRLKQAEPYGDIHLSKGPSFQVVSSQN